MRHKTLEQITAHDFAGLQVDLLQKLRSGNMSFEQAKWFVNQLTFDQREMLMKNPPEMVLYLKLLFASETLTLDALDGKETLTNATEVFTYIDSNFRQINQAGIKTKEQEVEAYEMLQDSTFTTMFGFLGKAKGLDKLCLEQSQIKNFCKKYKGWLGKDNNTTFFLIKDDWKFSLACVNVRPGKISVCPCKFEEVSMYDRTFTASRGCRIVVPVSNLIFKK